MSSQSTEESLFFKIGKNNSYQVVRVLQNDPAITNAILKKQQLPYTRCHQILGNRNDGVQQVHFHPLIILSPRQVSRKSKIQFKEKQIVKEGDFLNEFQFISSPKMRKINTKKQSKKQNPEESFECLSQTNTEISQSDLQNRKQDDFQQISYLNQTKLNRKLTLQPVNAQHTDQRQNFYNNLKEKDEQVCKLRQQLRDIKISERNLISELQFLKSKKILEQETKPVIQKKALEQQNPIFFLIGFLLGLLVAGMITKIGKIQDI